MKIIIIILILSSISYAKPLERNEVTKAHKDKLSKLLGSSNKSLLSKSFDGAIRITYPGKVTDTYVFENDKVCVFTYYFNKKGTITDLQVSSEDCFGPHKLKTQVGKL